VSFSFYDTSLPDRHLYEISKPYNTICDVYAPKYKAITVAGLAVTFIHHLLRSFFSIGEAHLELAKERFDNVKSARDAYRAFLNERTGVPILAGHSQGAAVLETIIGDSKINGSLNVLLGFQTGELDGVCTNSVEDCDTLVTNLYEEGTTCSDIGFFYDSAGCTDLSRSVDTRCSPAYDLKPQCRECTGHKFYSTLQSSVVPPPSTLTPPPHIPEFVLSIASFVTKLFTGETSLHVYENTLLAERVKHFILEWISKHQERGGA
jgi:hypothetical protein